MTLIIFLFGIWFNPMQITQLIYIGEDACAIQFSDGRGEVVDAGCNEVQDVINKAWR